MLSKTFAAIGLFSLTASPVMAANFLQINLPPAPNASPFNTDVTGSLGGGTIILNLLNGNLTGCPNGSNTQYVPLGHCGRIGVMDITGVNQLPGNIQVSVSGQLAYITNVNTGFTAICTAITTFTPPSNPTSAVYSGSCIARGAF